MNELKRLYSPKTLLILLAMVIINLGLFMLSCSPEKEITLTGDELQSYIESYPDFLRKTKENSADLSVLNMYKTGYAADNIRKTAEAYRQLADIKITEADNRGAVLFSDYQLTDIFLLAFLLIMSVRMLNERKKGLVNMFRSTERGRGVLYFQRVGILLFSAVIGAVLLYGGDLIGMKMMFGDCGLGRSVQSLPEFMQCTYGITIGQYFLLTCALKAFACFTAALAFFILISELGTAAAYVTAGVITVAELLLYSLIIPVSAVNALKYINIFAVLDCRSFLSVCCNLNIFGKAVPALDCNLIFMSAAVMMLIILGYIVHGRMHVPNRDLLESITARIGRIAERSSFQRTLFGWEWYKLMIKQGGIVFMIGAFLLTYSASVKYSYFYPINFLESQWYDTFSGTITPENVQAAENEYSRLEALIEKYRKRLDEQYSRENPDENAIARLSEQLGKMVRSRDALIPVLEDLRDGLIYTERTGNEIRLIKPYAYDLLLNRDKQTRNRASLYILIGLIGALSGVFAYDRQNNMRNTLNSSYRGRGLLITAKVGTVLIASVILCVAVHMIQLLQVGRLLTYNDMDAPVQSLMFMRGFIPYVSISQYLIMLFAVRSLAAFGVGIVCTLVSRFCSDTMTAMGVSIFMLAVPAVFSQIIPGAEMFSAVYLICGDYFR